MGAFPPAAHVARGSADTTRMIDLKADEALVLRADEPVGHGDERCG
jgi:hypothetical protein